MVLNRLSTKAGHISRIVAMSSSVSFLSSSVVYSKWSWCLPFGKKNRGHDRKRAPRRTPGKARSRPVLARATVLRPKSPPRHDGGHRCPPLHQSSRRGSRVARWLGRKNEFALRSRWLLRHAGRLRRSWGICRTRRRQIRWLRTAWRRFPRHIRHPATFARRLNKAAWQPLTRTSTSSRVGVQSRQPRQN